MTQPGEGRARPRAARADLGRALAPDGAWWSRRWLPLRLVVGILVPLVVVAAFLPAHEPSRYRPGVLLVAAVAAVAMICGRWPAVAATVVSYFALWLAVAPPRWSFAVDAVEATGLVLFAAAALLVVALVSRLVAVRASEVTRRAELDALVDSAPVGIALFDAQLRFRRVNRHLAELNGRPAAEHIGRRPSELSDDAGRHYEGLLAEVRETGRPLIDQHITADRGDTTHHYRASYLPVTAADGSIVGIAATVEDVTAVTTAGNRAAAVAACAERLTGVDSVEGVGDVIAPLLATALDARVAFAVRTGDGDALRVLRLDGYGPEVADEWLGRRWELSGRSPLTDVGRDGRYLELHDAAAFDAAYPEMREIRLATAGEACVVAPLRDVLGDGAPGGVLYLSWARPTRLDHDARTFVAVVVSVAELALSRVRSVQHREQDRFQAALDAMLDSVALAAAVRDEHGRVVDFTVEFANRAALDAADRPADRLVGQRLLDAFPGLAEARVFDRLVDVVTSGQPLVDNRLRYSSRDDGGAPGDGCWSLRAMRFRDGLLATWRDVSDEVRAEAELRVARDAQVQEQTSMQVLIAASLPSAMPDHPRLELVARYLPAATESPVGGDWYDAFTLDDGRIGLVVADIAGHGAEAASYMVQLRNKLRGAAYGEGNPGVVLSELSAMTVRTGTLATCCYVVVDPDSGVMRWANAGHLPPIVSGRAGSRLLEHPGQALLGISRRMTYRCYEHRLAPGDVLALYTDGLVERREEGIDTGLGRLVDASRGVCGPLDAVADKVVGAVLAPDHADDVCLLLARYG